MARMASRWGNRRLAALGLLPVGFLAAAMVRAGQQPGPEGDTSVLPAPPPVAAPPTAQVTPNTGLEVVVFRAGPAPFPWLQPGLISKSFVSETPTRLSVVALARPKAGGGLTGPIRWTVNPPAGFRVLEDAVLEGPELHVTLVRPEGNPTGAGAPLSVTVTAETTLEGTRCRTSRTLTQDPRDRLRQEYVDLQRGYVPARKELLDETQFAAAFGKKYPGVTFARLNFTRIPGSEDRYPVILTSERVVATLHQTEKTYGRPVVVTSAFRNPVRQEEVHGSVDESHHQYGRALDLYVQPDSAPPHTGRTTTSEGDWLRLAAAALRSGGVWVEPMEACHVNTAGCHVHVDIREQGARSEIVQVVGRVTDPTGRPVPGARVRIAGMPGVTNAEGRFSVKHVLVPGEYELRVEGEGIPAATQTVAVGSETPAVTVALPAIPRTRLASGPGRRGHAPAIHWNPAAPRRAAAQEEQTARKAGALSPATPLPDPAAAAAGLAAGGAAAAAHALWKRKAKRNDSPAADAPPDEAKPTGEAGGDASVDPAEMLPGKPGEKSH